MLRAVPAIIEAADSNIGRIEVQAFSARRFFLIIAHR